MSILKAFSKFINNNPNDEAWQLLLNKLKSCNVHDGTVAPGNGIKKPILDCEYLFMMGDRVSMFFPINGQIVGGFVGINENKDIIIAKGDNFNKTYYKFSWNELNSLNEFFDWANKLINEQTNEDPFKNRTINLTPGVKLLAPSERFINSVKNSYKNAA